MTDWKVRLANPEDAERISEMAYPFRNDVSPYVLAPDRVRTYIDEWLVAEDLSYTIPVFHKDIDGSEYCTDEYFIGGALHFVAKKTLRNYNYLKMLKQVDPDIVEEWYNSDAIFMSQPTCPGKGSLRAIADYLKEARLPLWCWLSVKSPVRKFYEEQLGFKFGPGTYHFWNAIKGDYSDFGVGVWTP